MCYTSRMVEWQMKSRTAAAIDGSATASADSDGNLTIEIVRGDAGQPATITIPGYVLRHILAGTAAHPPIRS